MSTEITRDSRKGLGVYVSIKLVKGEERWQIEHHAPSQAHVDHLSRLLLEDSPSTRAVG